ncbi:MAG: 5-formyltetrahydrofolate cyclo-ligase [Pseudomonadota bacterium]
MSPDELRQRNRKIRAELSEAQQAFAAQSLFDNISRLSVYHEAQKIAVYYAVNGEISLIPLIEHAWKNGKHLYLPNLDQQSLRFSPYPEGQKMRINKFRLPEPDVDDSEMLQPEDLDLVLAPLVVFDEDRNRIGMGGGFYDRSFEFRKVSVSKAPVLVGVAHEVQKEARLVPESWDVKLDLVVTDKAIYD